MTKYALTEDTISFEGKTLHRIQALTDFDDVRSGDFGGYVESESNLDQDDTCWVYDDAKVLENAKVKNQAKVRGCAIVRGHAKVVDQAEISDHAVVMDQAFVFHDAKVMNYARVYGSAEVYSDAVLSEYAQASQHAVVTTNVSGKAHVTEVTTRPPLSLSGLQYQVTFMDSTIQFDCVTKTKDEWLNTSKEELVRIGGLTAVRFHKRYLSLLTHIAEHHFKEHQSNF